MPKLLIFGTDIFENRMHIHVGRKGTQKLCKIWLEPTVEISKPGELSVSEQREVVQITELYKAELIKQWQQFVSGQKIKILKVN